MIPAIPTAVFTARPPDGRRSSLYGPRRHGEPAWACRGRHGYPRQWHRQRRASEIMLKARSKAAGRRITAGEDKAYDMADHVANLRSERHPHVTQNWSDQDR